MVGHKWLREKLKGISKLAMALQVSHLVPIFHHRPQKEKLDILSSTPQEVLISKHVAKYYSLISDCHLVSLSRSRCAHPPSQARTLWRRERRTRQRARIRARNWHSIVRLLARRSSDMIVESLLVWRWALRWRRRTRHPGLLL